MKTLRVLTQLGLGLFIIWGLIALFHRLTHEPAESRFFFWAVLPYPVLIAITVFMIAGCARNDRPESAGFSWFAVGIGAAASIGLAFIVTTGLSSVMSWAYFGYVSLTHAPPTDPELVVINIAVTSACSIWAGAISVALSPNRPSHHALATGTALLLWFGTGALLVQPIVVSQLLVALVLPLPLAALGCTLMQRAAALRR